MCNDTKRKYRTQIEAGESQLFDLYLWPPAQGHIDDRIPVDVDLLFDIETLELGGISCTVFLTRAEVQLSLSDFVLIRGTRLGDSLKPIVDTQAITEKITQKVIASGKLDLNTHAESSGILQGAIGAALSASRERHSHSESVVEHTNVFHRVRPSTRGRWIIAESEKKAGGRLLGKYISAPTETGASGYSLCDVQEVGEKPLLTLSLYCRPMDVKFEIPRDSTLIGKLRGNLVNKERVAAAVRAKSLKGDGNDGLIMLAYAILTHDVDKEY